VPAGWIERVNMNQNDKKIDKTIVDADPSEKQDHTIVDFVDEDLTPADGFQASSPIGFLIIKNGTYRGRVFQLVEQTTVGRKEGNIIVRDPQMSRRHARVIQEKEHFFVEDLNTINGTFVNGKAVVEKTFIKQDDVILIGETEFEFKTLG